MESTRGLEGSSCRGEHSTGGHRAARTFLLWVWSIQEPPHTETEGSTSPTAHGEEWGSSSPSIWGVLGAPVPPFGGFSREVKFQPHHLGCFRSSSPSIWGVSEGGEVPAPPFGGFRSSSPSIWGVLGRGESPAPLSVLSEGQLRPQRSPNQDPEKPNSCSQKSPIQAPKEPNSGPKRAQLRPWPHSWAPQGKGTAPAPGTAPPCPCAGASGAGPQGWGCRAGTSPPPPAPPP